MVTTSRRVELVFWCFDTRFFSNFDCVRCSWSNCWTYVFVYAFQSMYYNARKRSVLSKWTIQYGWNFFYPKYCGRKICRWVVAKCLFVARWLVRSCVCFRWLPFYLALSAYRCPLLFYSLACSLAIAVTVVVAKTFAMILVGWLAIDDCSFTYFTVCKKICYRTAPTYTHEYNYKLRRNRQSPKTIRIEFFSNTHAHMRSIHFSPPSRLSFCTQTSFINTCVCVCNTFFSPSN